MKKYIRAIEQVKKMSKHYCIFFCTVLSACWWCRTLYFVFEQKIDRCRKRSYYSNSNTGDLSGDEIQEGIQIYRLPCYDLLGGRYPVFKRNKEFKKVKKLIERNQYDLVIINTRFYLHSLYGAKFC